MNKRHVVRLTERERAALHQRLKAGRGAARHLLHSRILLKADQSPDGPAWTDWAIAAALDVSVPTVERLEIHYAPKHGSWLSITEIELSTMSGQCLGRRIPDWETPEHEVAAWETERNVLGGPVNLRFTTEDARVKLKRLYPSIDG